MLDTCNGMAEEVAIGVMAIMAIIAENGDYGHNHHFRHNDHYGLIWVSKEASRLQEYSAELQNLLKYFF